MLCLTPPRAMNRARAVYGACACSSVRVVMVQIDSDVRPWIVRSYAYPSDYHRGYMLGMGECGIACVCVERGEPDLWTMSTRE
eukprot:7389013-Prymnesium_polylepis.1